MKNDVQPLRVLLKAIFLFVAFNIIFALVNPPLYKITLYNHVVPGRTRLPFGGLDDPYSVVVDDIDVMFLSHRISAFREPDEYRVLLLGDSSVWGEGLGAFDVISEQWNNLDLQCDGKKIKVYNLGYPHPSVVKDLVILDSAIKYQPDLVVWFVTLNTLVSQRVNPFLVANRQQTIKILDSYPIPFNRGEELVKTESGFFEKTILGQRSNLARQIKLQILGVVWAATGVDIKPEEARPNSKIRADVLYHGLDSSVNIKDMLLLTGLSAGIDIVQPIPVLIVNEPIFITEGEYAAIRYNSFYPRWAYDQYREALALQAQKSGWNYLDLWDALPPEYFSDAGFHLSIPGERLLNQLINPVLQSIACGKNLKH